MKLLRRLVNQTRLLWNDLAAWQARNKQIMPAAGSAVSSTTTATSSISSRRKQHNKVKVMSGESG